jgi:hypothetical protein
LSDERVRNQELAKLAQDFQDRSTQMEIENRRLKTINEKILLECHKWRSKYENIRAVGLTSSDKGSLSKELITVLTRFNKHGKAFRTLHDAHEQNLIALSEIVSRFRDTEDPELVDLEPSSSFMDTSSTVTGVALPHVSGSAIRNVRIAVDRLPRGRRSDSVVNSSLNSPLNTSLINSSVGSQGTSSPEIVELDCDDDGAVAGPSGLATPNASAEVSLPSTSSFNVSSGEQNQSETSTLVENDTTVVSEEQEKDGDRVSIRRRYAQRWDESTADDIEEPREEEQPTPSTSQPGEVEPVQPEPTTATQEVTPLVPEPVAEQPEPSQPSETQRPKRRTASQLSYAEPTLNSKLRRGDPCTDPFYLDKMPTAAKKARSKGRSYSKKK